MYRRWFLTYFLIYLVTALAVELSISLVLYLAYSIIFSIRSVSLEALRLIGIVVGGFGVLVFGTSGTISRVLTHAGIPIFAPRATLDVVEASEKVRLEELTSLSVRVGGVVGSIILIAIFAI